MEKINKIHKHKLQLIVGMQKEHKEKIQDFLNHLNELIYIQGSFVDHIDNFRDEQNKEENKSKFNASDILSIKRQINRESKHYLKLEEFLQYNIKFYKNIKKIAIDHDCSIHPKVGCPVKN